MLAVEQYCSYVGRSCVEVRCKLCHAPIMDTSGGTLGPTPAYAELVVAMSDPNGLLSKHETGCCRDCRERVLAEPLTDFELSALYACDLLQWAEDAKIGGVSEEYAAEALAWLRARKPLRVLADAGQGDLANQPQPDMHLGANRG
jgi:hypothetical protein